MNVIISNKFRNELRNIGIDVSGVLEGSFTSSQIINAFSNYYYERIILDITAIQNYNNIAYLTEELKKIFTIIDVNKTILFIENIPELNNNILINNLINLKIYNYAFELNDVIELYNNPRTFSDLQSAPEAPEINTTSRIIGVKNVTSSAGATTLIYMMMQELSKKYTVKCIEIDKDDFKYFQKENMISVDSSEFINEVLREPHPDIILVDQNNYENDFIIKETIYLLEPSILKLNKALDLNPNLLESLQDKKVVLNRTSVSLPKLQDFEKESGIKSFDIIRNINERDKINPQVINLLTKLGFEKTNNGNIIHDDTEKRKSFF